MSVTVAKDLLTVSQGLTTTPAELVITIPATMDPSLAIHEFVMQSDAAWLFRCGCPDAPLFAVAANDRIVIPVNRPPGATHIWVRSAAGTPTLSILLMMY